MHFAPWAAASVLALAFTVPADAAEPIRLGELGDGSLLLLASVEGGAVLKTVRTRLVFPEPREVSGTRDVLAEVDVQSFDCANRTQETTRTELYNNTATSGEPLRVFDFPASIRQRISVDLDAGNTIAAIFRSVCSAVYMQGAVPAQVRSPQVIGAFPVTVPTPTPTPALGNVALADPRTNNLPVTNNPPVINAPSVSNAPPVYVAPVFAPPAAAAGALANTKPFPTSVFSLGLMGKLAEYVYFDEERAGFLAASLERLDMARRRFVRPDGQASALIEMAYGKTARTEARYRAMLGAKQTFVHNAQLLQIALPKLVPQPISSFRAELYQHQPSGEYILVFRGSQEALDWVSNAWLGLDLFAIEAPHYRAARELTEKLVSAGKVPVVVGHSLGGGMAQYVGLGKNLKVVAFNSSPLPARYISARLGTQVENIKVYSAIEFKDLGPQSKGVPDPVSLAIPKGAEFLNAFAGRQLNTEPMKAHLHLVKPICVKSVPSPFLSQEEDESMAAALNGIYYPTELGPLSGKVARMASEQVLQKAIAEETKAYFDDPVWLPENASSADKKVAAFAKQAVANAALDVYQTARAAVTMGSIMYNMMLGSSMQALKGAATPIAVTSAKLMLKSKFMPHSMERFNRGMMANLGNDVFLANTVSAECSPPSSIF